MNELSFKSSVELLDITLYDCGSVLEEYRKRKGLSFQKLADAMRKVNPALKGASADDLANMAVGVARRDGQEIRIGFGWPLIKTLAQVCEVPPMEIMRKCQAIGTADESQSASNELDA